MFVVDELRVLLRRDDDEGRYPPCSLRLISRVIGSLVLTPSDLCETLNLRVPTSVPSYSHRSDRPSVECGLRVELWGLGLCSVRVSGVHVTTHFWVTHVP